MPTNTIAPLAVACPDCKAARRQRCTTGSGVERTWPHVAREKAAAKAAKLAAKETASRG